MKEITIEGYVIMIDDVDEAYVLQHTWKLQKGPLVNKGYLYFRRTETSGRGGSRVSLHRDIMGIVTGNPLLVDHIDGNTLNNTRANLRVCTRAENIKNRKKIMVSNTTGYKGVSRRKNADFYEVAIKNNKITWSVGRFTDIIEAAEAYDMVALYFHKEFARLNFPNKIYDQKDITQQGDRLLSGLRKSNTSGYPNVMYHKQAKRWVAIIQRHPTKQIGGFQSAIDAHNALIVYNQGLK